MENLKLKDLVVGRKYNMDLEGEVYFMGVDERFIHLTGDDMDKNYNVTVDGIYSGSIGFKLEDNPEDIDFLELTEIKTNRQSQIELINSIKDQVAKLEDRTSDGFDLALDILDLLKNIKPTV